MDRESFATIEAAVLDRRSADLTTSAAQIASRANVARGLTDTSRNHSKEHPMHRQPVRSSLALRPLILFSAFGLFGFDQGGCFPEGCDPRKDVYSFLYKEKLPEQRIDGGPTGLLSLVFAPQRMQVDIKAETAKRGTGPARHVYLHELSLAMTSGSRADQTWDFVDSVSVSIEAADGSLAKQMIADIAHVSDGLRVLHFTIHDEVDLLPYVNKGALVTVSADGSQPEHDVFFDGEITLDVRL
jgi:hypothetical protein